MFSELSACWNVNCKSLSSSFSLTCKQPLFLPTASLPPVFQSFCIYKTLSTLLSFFCLPFCGASYSFFKCFHMAPFPPSYEMQNRIMWQLNIYSCIFNKYYWPHTMSQVPFWLQQLAKQTNHLPFWSFHLNGETINKRTGKLYTILEGIKCWERNKLGGKMEWGLVVGKL